MTVNRKLVVYGIIALLLLVGAGGLYYWHKKPLTAQLEIKVAPKSSTITINGKRVKTGVNALKPGSYTVVVSHPGFSDQKDTEVLSAGDRKFLGSILTPNSASTQNWYSTHPDDQKLAESISGKSLASDSASQLAKLPLMSQLPFIDNAYRVDYGPSKANPGDPTAVAIYIEYYSQDGKQQALDWLKFKGYDPAKLEIIYTNAGF